jgi:CRP-like cAMP-binding protein
MVSVSASRKPARPRNQLLAAMSASDLALLRAHLKPIAMPVFKDMEQPNRPIDTVYFMETGIASVVAIQPDDTKVEVGLIGREGMSGIAVVLGGDQSTNSTYIQVAGEGLRMPAKELRKAMDASDSLRNLLLKFAQAFTRSIQNYLRHKNIEHTVAYTALASDRFRERSAKAPNVSPTGVENRCSRAANAHFDGGTYSKPNPG